MAEKLGSFWGFRGKCAGPFAGVSVQWGAWSGVGMAANNAAAMARIRKSGMGLVSPKKGLQALIEVLGRSQQQPVVRVFSFNCRFVLCHALGGDPRSNLIFSLLAL